MKRLTGRIFREMIKSAQANLFNNQKRIDTLNVFPVPDGDTGLNMSMTLTGGLEYVSASLGDDLNEVARVLSKGLLMGARGNSGVITSQIFRGFYQYLENHSDADAYDLAKAFENGSVVAYKAIMKPVERHYLNKVIREGSQNALKRLNTLSDATIENYFDILVEEMSISLENTPNHLPILKEVGVVDSGGAGLLCIIEGLNAYLKGQAVTISNDKQDEIFKAALEIENDEFGYCTEFIFELNDDWKNKFDENKLRKSLSDIEIR